MIKNNKLYLGGVEIEALVERFGTPLYVYEEDVIRERYEGLVNAISYDKLKMLYACKANSNPEIMKIFLEYGCGIDAVSPYEILLALKVGFKPEQILFTGNNVKDEEMELVINKGIIVNIDSLSQLERYGKINPNSTIFVRINPALGMGFHTHVITGGEKSKFGIYYNKVGKIKEIAKKYNLEIVGLHMHVGSRFLDYKPFLKAMKALLRTAEDFPEVEYIDFGGGLGVPYSREEQPINVAEFGKAVSKLFIDWCKNYGTKVMMFENGRYYVAESGHLLTRVISIKETPKFKFIGTDTGFNHLIRPVMYGSYHEILNASNVNDVKEEVVVVGNICESGDIFTQDENGIKPRMITKVKEGDILSIETVGAYGFSMASNYNLRPRPAEVLVKNGKAKLIRKRETFEDLIRC